MKILKSFNVQIWCGLRESYTDKIHTLEETEHICENFVNDIKECITITPTKFKYVGGSEDGFIIGLISYPLYPRKQKEILNRAFTLSEILLRELKQEKITITTPHKSYTLQKQDYV